MCDQKRPCEPMKIIHTRENGKLVINGFPFEEMLEAYTTEPTPDIHGEVVSGEEVLRRGQCAPGTWKRGDIEYLIPQEHNWMEDGVLWSFRTASGFTACINEESYPDEIKDFTDWVKSAPWTFSSRAYWEKIRNAAPAPSDTELPF